MPQARFSRADAGLALALGLVSLLGHSLLLRLDVWQWPVMDNWPALARSADPAFAAGDFFTDATSLPNPRGIFVGLVRLLALPLDGSWMQAMGLLRAGLAAFLPPLYFLLLLDAWRGLDPQRRGGEAKGWVLAAVCLLVSLSVRAQCYPSIACWTIFSALPIPQSVAILLALSAALLRPVSLAGAVVLGAASTAVHPAVSLYALAFGALLRRRYAQDLLWLALAWLLPALLLQRAFAGGELPGARFVELYCRRMHPYHYVPAEFGSLTRFPWWAHFIAVQMLFAVPCLGLWRAGDRKGAAWGLLAWGAYVSAVALQWLAVEHLLSRSLAALSPIRFSGFGAWLALPLWLAWAGGDPAEAVADRPRVRAWALGALVLAGASGLACWAAFRDPRPIQEAKDPGYFTFVRSTPAGSVFAVSGDLVHAHLVVGGRPSFASMGVTFRDTDLAECVERTEAVNGTWMEWRRQDGAREHYRKMGPADFAALGRQRRLDYVVREPGPDPAFAKLKPVYEGPLARVYALHRGG